jgi:hypothetical protein
MTDLLEISPADLLVDEENPRLTQPNVGQHEAARAIARKLKRKIQMLAADIVEHGTNPSDLPFVMRLKSDPKRFIVLEGNRRLVALRALENPEAFNDAVPPGVLKSLRKLSKKYQDNPVEKILCVVVKERKDANHWIKLRHTGENEGAGIVTWGSDESHIFDARVGNNIFDKAAFLAYTFARSSLGLCWREGSVKG